MVFFKGTDFSGATFTGETNFSGAIFTKDANFSRVIFNHNPIFMTTTSWVPPWDKPHKARFYSTAAPKDYNFEVSHDSPYKIETREQEYYGIRFIIPKDAELFDPDDPSN